MHKFLVRQAVVVPLTAMLLPILWAFLLPGYSSVSQHISEVELLEHPIATFQRIIAIVTGISIMAFGIGVSLAKPNRITFTAVSAALFGISMVSNGVFIMTSPLHGLFPLPLAMAFVPVCFALEFCRDSALRKVRNWSLAAALFNLSYMCLMIFGFDPPEFSGLTQRIATVVIFTWYTYASLEYLRFTAAR